MKKFSRTFTATIHYKDHSGSHYKEVEIPLAVTAENEESAKYIFYSIAKNAYLTWGKETPIIEEEV